MTSQTTRSLFACGNLLQSRLHFLVPMLALTWDYQQLRNRPFLPLLLRGTQTMRSTVAVNQALCRQTTPPITLHTHRQRRPVRGGRLLR